MESITTQGNGFKLVKKNICEQTVTNGGAPKCPNKKPISQGLPKPQPSPKPEINIPVPPKKPYIEPKKTDRRVFLNVMPLVNGRKPIGQDKEERQSIIDRLTYVLGSETKKINTSNFYGYLYGCLNGTVGLVFPYTPEITFNHSVNYETTDILHSNLSAHHYKNTPPPTISIKAVFTADNKEMAKHMLSAIWFLRACTKCDFGEQSNATAGVPPPILYLNGWDNMIDNIPVVISSFNYTLPQDKDYVHLGINLDKQSFEYNMNLNPNDDYMVDYENSSLKSTYKNGITFVNNQPVMSDNVAAENSLTSKFGSTFQVNDFYLSEWLPTELTINIELKIQYNLLKYKKVFDLDKYKMGILYLDNQKAGADLYKVTSNGCEVVELVETEEYYTGETKKITRTNIVGTLQDKQIPHNIKEAQKLKEKNIELGGSENTYFMPGSNKAFQNVEYEIAKTEIREKEGGIRKEVALIDGYAFDVGDVYKFDKSGWTW